MQSVVVLLAVATALSQAQPAATPAPAPAVGQAYYEFMLARHLQNQGDEKGALEALKRAAAADPTSAEIQAEFASLYARQDDATAAVDAAERALKLDPNSTEAHRILGLVFAAWSENAVPPPAGRVPGQLRRDAIEHLAKIVDTPAVATDLSLQVTLARLYVRSGQPDKAIPVLEGVVSQGPFSSEPYTMLAEARLAVGRADEAAEALQMAAEVDPRRYSNLAELYEKMGKFREAAEAYTNAVEAVRSPSRELRLRMIAALMRVPEAEAIERARNEIKDLLTASPQDTRLLYLMSTASRQLGELGPAEEAARKLLSIDPTSLAGLNAMSQVFFAQHEPRKVIDLLTPFARDAAARAKGNENDAALLLSQLGIAFLQTGDTAQAINALTAARGFAPKNPTYEAYLVQAYSNGKQYARAADLAADALKRFPDNEQLLQLRADALANTGRVEEAAGLLQTLIDKDPLNAPALNSLGYMFAEHGIRLPEAIALIERALKVEPENPAYLDSLGWALFKSGKTEEAEPPLRKAATAMMSESVIQDHFGDVLARRGKHDEALEAWERALKGDGQGIDRATVEKKIKDARSKKK